MQGADFSRDSVVVVLLRLLTARAIGSYYTTADGIKLQRFCHMLRRIASYHIVSCDIRWRRCNMDLLPRGSSVIVVMVRNDAVGHGARLSSVAAQTRRRLKAAPFQKCSERHPLRDAADVQRRSRSASQESADQEYPSRNFWEIPFRPRT